MIFDNDLYDLRTIFIRIRNDVQYYLNGEILEQLICVLKNNNQIYRDNQIRKAVSLIKNLEPIKWNFVYHYNVYTERKLLKNQSIYYLLINVCYELKNLLDQQKYQQAYDLVDAIHCLPEIIADNSFSVPKSYWRIFIKPYRIKWDKTFLRTEEKNFRRQGGWFSRPLKRH